MKKMICLALALVLCLSVFAGCGAKTETPAATTAAAAATTGENKPAETEAQELEGEITFWHSFTQGPRLETLQAAADSFMAANPKVKITIETFSWADFYTKWTTGLASGNVPDMSTALPNHVVEMIDAECILPMDNLIDSIGRDRFYEAPLTEMTADGQTWAVPIYSHAQVMWYRTDLLEKYNLEVPTTWDELKAMSIDLQQKGICKDGIAWAGVQAEGLLCDMTTMLSAFGGAWTDEEGKMTFNSEAGVNALNFMRQSIEDGWADPASTTYTDRDALDPFIAGDTPFVMNWSFAWALSNDPSQSQVAGNVGVCLIPGTENVVSGSVTGGGGLGVLSCTKYPEYAW